MEHIEGINKGMSFHCIPLGVKYGCQLMMLENFIFINDNSNSIYLDCLQAEGPKGMQYTKHILVF